MGLEYRIDWEVGMWMMLLWTISDADAFRWADLIVPDAADDTLLEGPREPAVAYSPAHDLYVAVWAYDDPTQSDVDCPDGVWSLGYATSPDGLSWTPSGAPLVQPTPGSGDYWQCMMRQPAAVFLGDQLGVWFMAHQGSFAVPEQTGIGFVAIDLDAVSGLPVAATVSPTEALVTETHSHPSAIEIGGILFVTLEEEPDLYLASGVADALVFHPSSVLSHAQRAPSKSWLGDSFWSANLLCEDSFAFPFSMYFGTRSATKWGVGKAISSTGINWVMSVDPLTPHARDSDLRGFDVLRVGFDRLMYLEVPGPAGTDASLMAVSPVETWDNSDVGGEVCP